LIVENSGWGDRVSDIQKELEQHLHADIENERDKDI